MQLGNLMRNSELGPEVEIHISIDLYLYVKAVHGCRSGVIMKGMICG